MGVHLVDCANDLVSDISELQPLVKTLNQLTHETVSVTFTLYQLFTAVRIGVTGPNGAKHLDTGTFSIYTNIHAMSQVVRLLCSVLTNPTIIIEDYRKRRCFNVDRLVSKYGGVPRTMPWDDPEVYKRQDPVPVFLRVQGKKITGYHDMLGRTWLFLDATPRNIARCVRNMSYMAYSPYIFDFVENDDPGIGYVRRLFEQAARSMGILSLREGHTVVRSDEQMA